MRLKNKLTQYLLRYFNTTAQNLGINPEQIEKDYWVCFILNYLFYLCELKDAFLFKGGTSLSKSYQAINRFSEDVDVVIDWRLLDYDFSEPILNRSKNQQNRFIKDSYQRLDNFLQHTLLPMMQRDLEKLVHEKFKLYIDHQTYSIHFVYPTMIKENEFAFYNKYIRKEVKIELGPLAPWIPHETTTIRPYIAEDFPDAFEDDAVFVRTVAIEKTFWEKASILHQEVHRPADLAIPNRYARHYYDVYMLSISPHKEKFFNTTEYFAESLQFTLKFYPRSWLNKIEDMSIENIRLVPDKSRFEVIQQDYNDMKSMFFRSQEIPSFETIMNGLESLEQEIRAIKKVPNVAKHLEPNKH